MPDSCRLGPRRAWIEETQRRHQRLLLRMILVLLGMMTSSAGIAGLLAWAGG